MARSLNEVMKSLPKARRAKIEARATELIAEEASLQDLRKARWYLDRLIEEYQ